MSAWFAQRFKRRSTTANWMARPRSLPGSVCFPSTSILLEIAAQCELETDILASFVSVPKISVHLVATHPAIKVNIEFFEVCLSSSSKPSGSPTLSPMVHWRTASPQPNLAPRRGDGDACWDDADCSSLICSARLKRCTARTCSRDCFAVYERDCCLCIVLNGWMLMYNDPPPPGLQKSKCTPVP